MNRHSTGQIVLHSPISNDRNLSTRPLSMNGCISPFYSSTSESATDETRLSQAPRFESYLMTGDKILDLSCKPKHADQLPCSVPVSELLRSKPLPSPAECIATANSLSSGDHNNNGNNTADSSSRQFAGKDAHNSDDSICNGLSDADRSYDNSETGHSDNSLEVNARLQLMISDNNIDTSLADNTGNTGEPKSGATDKSAGEQLPDEQNFSESKDCLSHDQVDHQNCGIQSSDIDSCDQRSSPEVALVLEDMDPSMNIKAVDVPSAVRLARRIFDLDGFRRQEVFWELNKTNEFSNVVTENFLRYFDFNGMTLDAALRMFLKHCMLCGETYQREKIISHMSRRYLECNVGFFNSQDACHTLVCALLLLNTDLHEHHGQRPMTFPQFVQNLAGLNDGDDFERTFLLELYDSVRADALCDEKAPDSAGRDVVSEAVNGAGAQHSASTLFVSKSESSTLPMNSSTSKQHSIQFKAGHLMKKCCKQSGGKSTIQGKRSWTLCYCVLRDLCLYIFKNEQCSLKLGAFDTCPYIRLHHAHATKATDYFKRQRVIRLITADKMEYLLQANDIEEFDSWLLALNHSAALLSFPELANPVSNQYVSTVKSSNLPSSLTNLSLTDQLSRHESRVCEIKYELDGMEENGPSRSKRRSSTFRCFRKHYVTLQSELVRYRTYCEVLKTSQNKNE